MNEPKFTQRQRTFSKVCQFEVNIRAKPEVIWKLLTDAESFPRWNSRVIRIEGQIREGVRT
jgi:uncharacterized protein YndB with AHSA1/START domain